MRNPILSFIVVFCFLSCENIISQIKVDDINSNDKFHSVLVSTKTENTNEIKYLILGGIAINPSHNSGYVMLGIVNIFGGYIKGKSDFNFDESFTLHGKSTDSRYFSNETQKGRYAAMGGLLLRIASPIIMYGGLGYGNRWVNWKTLSGDIYRVDDISFQGLEVESGFILKIKKLVFSGGVSVTSFNYLEANIGIGIMFGILQPKIKATSIKASHGGKR